MCEGDDVGEREVIVQVCEENKDVSNLLLQSRLAIIFMMLHQLFLAFSYKALQNERLREENAPSIGYLKPGPTLILPQTPPTCTVASSDKAQTNFEEAILFGLRKWRLFDEERCNTLREGRQRIEHVFWLYCLYGFL